jgi:hypothetical protein
MDQKHDGLPKSGKMTAKEMADAFYSDTAKEARAQELVRDAILGRECRSLLDEIRKIEKRIGKL